MSTFTRANRKLLDDVLPADTRDPAEPISRRQRAALNRALQQAIQQELTQRQRDCLEQYYYQRLTQEAIAQNLENTRSTVCKHLQKARARLRHALEYTLMTDKRPD